MLREDLLIRVVAAWVGTVSLVVQLCPTLCDSMHCSTPGFPVHHQLPELAQTHVLRVGDAIQPSYPLSPLFGRTWEVPDGSVGTESACNAGDTEDLGLIPGLGRSSGRRKWQSIPVFLPEKSHGWRSMVGYNPRGCKIRHGWATKYGEFLMETAGGEENYSTWWCWIFSKVCFIHLV